jgi:hypothetical protein
MTATPTRRRIMSDYCPDCGHLKNEPCPARCRVCGYHFDRGAYLDKLTKALTAFDTWGQFVAAMERGYVPTIYSDRGVRYRRLVQCVRAAGFKVYDGGRVA